MVLSWNTRDLTLRALETARAGAEGLRAELLCVDNASTDGSAAAVARARPDVLLLENATNRGFAGGNNTALPHARGRYVCFLNSDAAPRARSLTHLVRHLQAHPDVGAVAPRLVGPDGQEQRAARDDASLLGFLHRYTPLRYTPLGRAAARRWTRGVRAEGPRDVASLAAACLVLPADLLARLGGFDPGYPFYFEDLDLCERVRAAGRRVVYLPDGPAVDHEGGAATARRGGPPRRAMMQGLVRYAARRAGPARGRAFAALLVPGVFALALAEPPRLALRAAVRGARGDAASARRTLRIAGSWLRMVERDGLALLRLLRRRSG